MRWFLLLPLLLTSGLSAADAGGKPRPMNGGADAAKADAKRTFQQQGQGAEAVRPTGKAPVVAGMYLWNGRADENYKPFYQWELRLMGGSAPARELKVRILTLGPSMQVVQTGPWKSVATLEAGRTVDLDYRLNCTAPAAYRVEVGWQGGSDGFLGWDRVMVPISEGALADAPFLACVNGNAEWEGKPGQTTATWWLWNIGGQAVSEGATVTVRFLTDEGQPVHQEVWKQPAKEAIPARSAKERRLVFRKKVPTDSLSFLAQIPNSSSAMAPVSADGLEVSRVRQQGDRLMVHLRNIGTEAMRDVAVTLTLVDQRGSKVATVILPSTNLPPGGQADLTGTVAKGISWQNYELSWSQGGPGH